MWLAVLVIGVTIDEPAKVPYLECAEAAGRLSEQRLGLPYEVGVGCWRQKRNSRNTALVEEIAAHARFLPHHSGGSARNLSSSRGQALSLSRRRLAMALPTMKAA